MSPTRRQGVCTPPFYAHNIPGFTQNQRGNPYYIITRGKYAGIYKYWHLANERATRTSEVARGVDSIDAACDAWEWTCKEYHVHEQRDELILYSDFILRPHEDVNPSNNANQSNDTNQSKATEDYDKHPAIDLAQLNIESKPNPVDDFTSSPSPFKTSPTNIFLQTKSPNPPALPKLSKSRSHSPSKSSSLSQTKGKNAESISSHRSTQESSTPGPSKKGHANVKQGSSTTGGLFVVKWNGSYEIHTSL
ncbi:hypothetical protein FB446DRAFT_795841 [Lentinula raphanica]|nr:hypothetical protein FB446DRAFT_795841 [Lentinula raphanica]